MNDQPKLLFALIAIGGMTSEEIRVMFDLLDTTAVNKRTKRLRHKMLLRVVEWRRQPQGARGAYIPVWGPDDPISPVGDAVRPPRVPVDERRRKWEERNPELAVQMRRTSARNYQRRRAVRIKGEHQQQAQALWGQLLRR